MYRDKYGRRAAVRNGRPGRAAAGTGDAGASAAGDRFARALYPAVEATFTTGVEPTVDGGFGQGLGA
ncbi:hypothetical protein [Streptomyces anulatus]|uniref:Uncharacterized protein n=1 Tax=Streptomyces anulatus TaxID=1892 RepID=A0ABZ1ZK13_STRAQ|nr:hypothetical protein [Streptomyces anulatus]